MNKIEQMIKDLCPEGVKWVKLGNVLNYEQPGKYIVTSTEYISKGTPVLTAGQTFILGYTDETDGVFKASVEKPVIIFDDFTTSFHWVDFDFKVKSSAMKMLRPSSNNALFKYVLFAMQCIDYVPADHSRQWIGTYSQFEIPLPPLPIQQEIVRILDSFTSMITNLETELASRQKQYEYYRNKLLTFDEGDESVEWKTLGEIATKHCSGSTPNKGKKEFYENGNIPWLRTQDVKFNEIAKIDSFITEEAVKKTSVKWIPENCVIVAISGATAGRCAINKIKTTTNQHCLNIEINKKMALYKYVFYCVRLNYDTLISMKQGARGDLNSSIILGLKLPIPNLTRQQEIVSTLDTFESLISNIKQELDARKKQYEYYREKLLTFE